MNVPDNVKFASTHEWARIEGEKAYIGISDHAQHAMGDIVFVELPQQGKVIKAGDSIGVVESVKAVSDIYTPLSGKVVEVNEVLLDSPEKINQAPYENWLIAIETSNLTEFEKMLTKEQYEDICKE
ncbi:MAG: glycine cleavage system protein GcvH [Deltaproteobacteria bacterium]